MKQYAVTTIGELLVEFQQQSDATYSPHFGGHPASVLCVPAKYGLPTAFVGKTGADYFGQKLCALLQQYGVDTSFIHTTPNQDTKIAFLHVPSDGKPQFELMQHAIQQVDFCKTELPIELLQHTGILHISGLSLISSIHREAVFEAISIARNAGAIVTFSVDYTPERWNDDAIARKHLLQGIKEADVAMLTQEELSFIGVPPMELLHNYSSHFILIPMGQLGCRYVGRDLEGYVQSSSPNAIVDPRGHSDIFMGAFLYKYFQENTPLKELNQVELERIIGFANQKALLSTSKEGVIRSIPDL